MQVNKVFLLRRESQRLSSIIYTLQSPFRRLQRTGTLTEGRISSNEINTALEKVLGRGKVKPFNKDLVGGY